MNMDLTSNVTDVSSHVNVAPEDALRGETGCATNPTIDIGISGDNVSTLIKPRIRPVSRNNLSNFRLSGLSKKSASLRSSNFAFKPPGRVDVVSDLHTVGPRPSPDGSKPNIEYNSRAVRCLCVKGIGRDHAKFSPVATASYRFLPQITLKRPILGEDAEKLQKSFSPGVIEIIKNENGEEEAVVADVRRDTCSRNVFRHEDLADAVLLTRKKNHVIFSIESTGALKSSDLLIEACKVMEEKCRTLLEALNL